MLILPTHTIMWQNTPAVSERSDYLRMKVKQDITHITVAYVNAQFLLVCYKQVPSDLFPVKSWSLHHRDCKILNEENISFPGSYDLPLLCFTFKAQLIRQLPTTSLPHPVSLLQFCFLGSSDRDIKTKAQRHAHAYRTRLQSSLSSDELFMVRDVWMKRFLGILLRLHWDTLGPPG